MNLLNIILNLITQDPTLQPRNIQGLILIIKIKIQILKAEEILKMLKNKKIKIEIQSQIVLIFQMI